jgi:hypothetical protein
MFSRRALLHEVSTLENKYFNIVMDLLKALSYGARKS